MAQQNQSAKERQLADRAAKTGKDADYQRLVNRQIRNAGKRG